MGRRKRPTNPDALLQALLAEADPTILARFTGQSPVASPDLLLSRLGEGDLDSPGPTEDVRAMDIVEVLEVPKEPEAATVDPPRLDIEDRSTAAPAPPEDVPSPDPVRADGLPVAVVDLWGDLDESSPPEMAPPAIETDEDGDS